MRKPDTSLFCLLRDTLARTARLMVGVPDYEAYVAHRRQVHPGDPVMTYEEFFRERQASRYGENGGKISRCC
ncbi:MAG: YbdD/YjiX family protein [Hyphomicrobium sp.]|uniref:YbdD/YjiX family protein n=1 Tax=Hyphomicrobium sp. TaxID=82 RepID=UPI003568EC32